MKNKITDLNNHLFAQLERLGDEDLTEEQLKVEVQRAKAITDVSSKIIDCAKTTLDAAKLLHSAGMDITKRSDIGNMLPEK